MPSLIRNAQPTDLNAIVQVHIKAWRETYLGIMADEILDHLNVEGRRRYWENALKDNRMIFVAEVDGQVVGFATCGPNREALKDYDAEVYAIYLLAAYHGMGLGKGLWKSCIKVLKAAGFKQVIVWVLKDNPSKQFYIKSGGAVEAEVPISLGKYSYAHEAYGMPL